MTSTTNKQIIENYLSGSIECLSKISKMVESLEDIIDIIQNAQKNRKKIFLIGNGGSASTASHFVCDLNKTSTLNSKNRIQAISLVDNSPIITAYSNDISYDEIFVQQLKNFVSSDDVLIAISGSGNSKNILNAIKFAKEKNMKTIGLTGFDGGQMNSLVDHCFIVPDDSMYRIEDMHLMINHILTSVLRDGIDYK